MPYVIPDAAYIRSTSGLDERIEEISAAAFDAAMTAQVVSVESQVISRVTEAVFDNPAISDAAAQNLKDAVALRARAAYLLTIAEQFATGISAPNRGSVEQMIAVSMHLDYKAREMELLAMGGEARARTILETHT